MNRNRLPLIIGGGVVALLAFCAVDALVVWFLFFRAGGTASQPTPVLVAAPSAATATPRPVVPTPEIGPIAPGYHTARVAFIVDASANMTSTIEGEYPRLAVVQTALEQLALHLPDNVRAGLRVYGHRVEPDTEGSCQDIELLLPIGEDGGAALAGRVWAFETRGLAPLAEALRQAGDDFAPDESNAIILIAGGGDTCGGDPCAIAAELRKGATAVTVYAIGLDVDDGARAELACLADAGGGYYFDARTGQALADALTQALNAIQAAPPAGQEMTVGGADKIAFLSDRDDPSAPLPRRQKTLYVMNADGRDQIRVPLAAWPGGATVPRFVTWLPNNEEVAVSSPENTDVVNVTSGLIRPVPYIADRDGGRDVYPRWSPDGVWIAFVHVVDSPEGVLGVMDARGENRRLLSDAHGLTHVAAVAWAPDSRRLVFSDSFSGTFTINTDGGGLAPVSGMQAHSLAWSPDGKRLALAGGRGDEYRDLWVMNPDGTGAVHLTYTPDLTETHPAWALDSRRLAYAASNDAGESQIFVIDVTRGIRTRLTYVGNNVSPAWSHYKVEAAATLTPTLTPTPATPTVTITVTPVPTGTAPTGTVTAATPVPTTVSLPAGVPVPSPWREGWTEYTLNGAAQHAAVASPLGGSGQAHRISGEGWIQAGLYRTFDVAGGSSFHVSAWTQFTATATTWVGIGADPTGGTDPRSGDVVWALSRAPGPWHTLNVGGVAEGDKVTIFLQVESQGGQIDVIFDGFEWQSK